MLAVLVSALGGYFVLHAVARWLSIVQSRGVCFSEVPNVLFLQELRGFPPLGESVIGGITVVIHQC